MKMTRLKKTLSFIACIVLIAAIALFTIACGDNEAYKTGDNDQEVTALGEGERSFTFIAADKDGNETAYEIHTDKEIVGEALEELELIAGEEGEFGLYVKTVDGTTLDYSKDKKYWAFYINGEYAMTGVDTTQVTEGAEYAFRAE